MLCLLPWLGSAWAATLTVEADGSGDLPTLQAALSAAADGDTILVGAGTYTGTLSWAGKDVWLESRDGAGAAVLDGGGSWTTLYFSGGETAAAGLSGFVVKNAGAGCAAIRSASPSFEDTEFTGCGGGSSSGGAVNVSGGEPSFTRCTFTDNEALRGGHLHVNGGDVLLDSCVLTEGYAATYGGGVDVAYGSLTLVGSTLSANSAGLAGGGAWVDSSGQLSLQNSEVTENTGPDIPGAGIYVNAGALLAQDTLFERNYATDLAGGALGGGIALGAGSATLVDCTFDTNRAYYGGGIYASYGTVLTLTRTIFQDNYATYGGGVHAYYSVQITDTEGLYTGNQGVSGAGAVFSSYLGVLSFTDSVFDENFSNSGVAGAVYAGTYGSLLLQGVSLLNNTAYSAGGAMYLTQLDGGAALNECTVQDNSSTVSDGGAIYVYDRNNLQVSSSSFEGNSAGYQGGAISAAGYGTSLTLLNSSFEGNSAVTRGGALYQYGTSSDSFTAQGNQFLDNEATQSGGAVFVMYNLQISLSDNLFAANGVDTGGFGGALALVYSGRVDALRNQLLGNHAEYAGGLWLQGNALGLVANNLVAENSAGTGGGLCVSDERGLSVVNNNLLSNVGTDRAAALCAANSVLDLRNNVLAWNAGAPALAFYDELTSSSAVIGWNDLFENSGGNSAELPGDAPLMENENLGLDPGFVAWTADSDLGNDALTLQDSSPLIDAGDPAVLDLDGSRSDIGLWGGPTVVLEDLDADGVLSDRDCDDEDAAVYPGANDTPYDGVDSDCAGDNDADQDSDGLDALEAGGLDCDDLDPEVGPCPEDSGVGPSDKACGCAATPSSAGLLSALFGLILLRRRSIPARR